MRRSASSSCPFEPRPVRAVVVAHPQHVGPGEPRARLVEKRKPFFGLVAVAQGHGVGVELHGDVGQPGRVIELLGQPDRLRGPVHGFDPPDRAHPGTEGMDEEPVVPEPATDGFGLTAELRGGPSPRFFTSSPPAARIGARSNRKCTWRSSSAC